MKKYDPTQLIISMNPDGHSGSPMPSFRELDGKWEKPAGWSLRQALRLSDAPLAGALPGSLVSWDTWVSLGIRDWATRRPIKKDVTRYGIALYADRGEGLSPLHAENEHMRGWRKPGLAAWSIDSGDVHFLWADETTGLPTFRLSHTQDQIEELFDRFDSIPRLSPFLGWEPVPTPTIEADGDGYRVTFDLINHPQNART